MTQYIEYIKTGMYMVGQYLLYPLLAGLFVGLYQYVTNWLKNRKFHSIEFSNSKNMDIQMLLTELRVELGADRAYLSLFSNGEHYIDGSPMIKMSRTCEVTDAGVSHESHNWQSIQISTISQFLESVITHNGLPEIMIIKDMKDNRAKQMMMSQGVYSTVRCTIKRGGDIIGLVGADFSHDKKDIDTNFLIKKGLIISEKLAQN